MNHSQPRPRFTGAFKVLVISTTLFASIAASAQFAVAGFAIGQEMKSCPDSSVPVRKDARNSGIACRFPERSRAVFSTPADQLSLATDQRGEVESVLSSGSMPCKPLRRQPLRRQPKRTVLRMRRRCTRSSPSGRGCEGMSDWSSSTTTTPQPRPTSSSTDILDSPSFSIGSDRLAQAPLVAFNQTPPFKLSGDHKMKFRIEYIFHQQRPVSLFARQLEPGRFALSENFYQVRIGPHE